MGGSETTNRIREGGDVWEIGGRLNVLAGGVISIEGVPLIIGGISKAFYVDPLNGGDANDGLSPTAAFKTLKKAYDECTDGANDVIYFIPGDTADEIAAAITWSKNYTHLIGLSGDLPGMGQRCRVVGNTTIDPAVLLTISGSGCIFKNIKFSNETDANADSGAVIVSGGRNYFENCMFAGMAHATPAARPGSYSLKVSGGENHFLKCTIGLDTIIRADANSELIISGVRNSFKQCLIHAYSVTAGKFLVSLDNTLDLRYTLFEDCVFFNYTPNWVTGIANAMHLPSGGNTYWVILRGDNILVGTGLGWADTVTHLFSAAPVPAAGFGVGVNPTT
jgi:hypothetical protein